VPEIRAENNFVDFTVRLWFGGLGHQQNVQHRIRLCNEVVAKGNAANAAKFTDHNVKQDIGRFFTK
jgi:hypothetical protein